MTSSTSVSIPDQGQEIVNRVFIGGLARDTSELELENFFSTFGEVVDVRIVCDRKTGFNRGYGFVTFTSMQARDDLLKKDTVDYKGGRKLRLRKAFKREMGGQFFPSSGSSSSNAQSSNGGAQMVLVPVVEPTTYTNNQVPVYYIQQPNVGYHNFMAQQYNYANLQTGPVYYFYY